MSSLDDYSAALRSITHEQLPSGVFRLLSVIEQAWAAAEAGIPSEAESRRWSPVCDEAMRFVEAAAQ